MSTLNLETISSLLEKVFSIIFKSHKLMTNFIIKLLLLLMTFSKRVLGYVHLLKGHSWWLQQEVILKQLSFYTETLTKDFWWTTPPKFVTLSPSKSQNLRFLKLEPLQSCTVTSTSIYRTTSSWLLVVKNVSDHILWHQLKLYYASE